jgi:hypothetical protein
MRYAVLPSLWQAIKRVKKPLIKSPLLPLAVERVVERSNDRVSQLGVLLGRYPNEIPFRKKINYLKINLPNHNDNQMFFNRTLKINHYGNHRKIS